MQIGKWGNSLAVRLPSAVVDALGLREGDDIEIEVAGSRNFKIGRDHSAGTTASGPQQGRCHRTAEGTELVPASRLSVQSR